MILDFTFSNDADRVRRAEFLGYVRKLKTDIFDCSACVFESNCIYQQVYEKRASSDVCMFGGWGTMQYFGSGIPREAWDVDRLKEGIQGDKSLCIKELASLGISRLFKFKETGSGVVFGHSLVLSLIDWFSLNANFYKWIDERQSVLYISATEVYLCYSEDLCKHLLKVPFLAMHFDLENYESYALSGVTKDVRALLNYRRLHNMSNFIILDGVTKETRQYESDFNFLKIPQSLVFSLQVGDK